jgi:hypothetical protein
MSDYYKIVLGCLREQRNVHQREAPRGAPFRPIGPNSPKPWRKEVERLAYYFRREMGFDFAPYTADESDNSLEVDRDRVLAFTKEEWGRVRFVGAVGIRWREWDDAPSGWSVSWAWVHPYERRKGYLAKVWPFVLEMFPNPRIEPPVSTAMKRFLKKVGYSTQDSRIQAV